ncbi:MAG: DUF3465 domain-containing protein [Cyanobacteria bacterium P01_H01_bin.121]
MVRVLLKPKQFTLITAALTAALVLSSFGLIYGVISPSVALASEAIIANRSSDQLLKEAFDNQRSNFQVEGQGVVTVVLSDDLQGSRHQRFVIRLNSGQTLLIAHNIDLAPRVAGIQPGDLIRFYGEYEWNARGGVIHWTHIDPNGQHPNGWLKHKGLIYQ